MLDFEVKLDLVGSGGRGASSMTVGFSSDGLEAVRNGFGLDESAPLLFAAVSLAAAEKRVLGFEAALLPNTLGALDATDESDDSPI